MQKIQTALRKVEQKLIRGDKKIIAEMLKQPYTNVTTAFSGKAGLDLNLKVLDAAQKVISRREKRISKRINKVVAKHK